MNVFVTWIISVVKIDEEKNVCDSHLGTWIERQYWCATLNNPSIYDQCLLFGSYLFSLWSMHVEICYSFVECRSYIYQLGVDFPVTVFLETKALFSLEAKFSQFLWSQTWCKIFDLEMWWFQRGWWQWLTPMITCLSSW